MITSHTDCVNSLLKLSIFFEKVGLSAVSEDMACILAFLQVRATGGARDLPATGKACSGSFVESVRSLYGSVTIKQPSRYQGRIRSEPEAKMNKHDWMDDVLRDVIAYAVLNGMPEVARYVALGLDALHLHVYEEERRAARTVYAKQSFQLEAVQQYVPVGVEAPLVAAANPVGESRSELR